MAFAVLVQALGGRVGFNSHDVCARLRAGRDRLIAPLQPSMLGNELQCPACDASVP
jgi:hypothetical protein